MGDTEEETRRNFQDASAAHFDAMTSGPGVESCAVCHGPGAELDTVLVHKTR